MQKGHKIKILVFITFTLCLLPFLFSAIPQDTQYHHFSDRQTILGIPNFWNVISNLPFLIVGILGLIHIRRSENLPFKLAYYILFGGVTLVAFGSSYYHLNPNNMTLVWDRLPMTLAFMSLFSIIIYEYIDKKIGSKLLIPLLIIGLLSVLYWNYSENTGKGDLRPYLLVQFIPVVLIPLILLMFSETKHQSKYIWWMVTFYVIAKSLESGDKTIFEITGVIGGHPFKHITAAIAVYYLYSRLINSTESV